MCVSQQESLRARARERDIHTHGSSSDSIRHDLASCTRREPPAASEPCIESAPLSCAEKSLADAYVPLDENATADSNDRHVTDI